MQELLVAWRVVACEAPRPSLPCRRCEARRPFVSSGKFRVNAQKKRLDAWLIYRCAACEETWNLPLLERCAVAEVAPDLLDALTRNCAELAQRTACNLAQLKRHAGEVEFPAEVLIAKRIEQPGGEAPSCLVIALAVPLPCRLRLDRLLQRELGVPRKLLQVLAAAGGLEIPPPGARALAQPVRDGQRVALRLASLADSPALLARVLASAAADMSRNSSNSQDFAHDLE